MIEMSLTIILVLFLVGVIAGWIDAIAGGGGLITVPALILAGASPAAAIATNKVQASVGTFTSALYFLRQGAISVRANRLPLMAVCLGSMAGGFALTQINATFLNYLVPMLLILIGAYFLFFAKNLDDRREPRLTASRFNFTAAPALGFYDGFFGPGTGSLMATSFVTLRGFPIRDATAHAKLFNFVSNFSALVYFVFFGQIFWLAGGAMVGGQILGSYLGAHIALKAGAKIIRPLTIIVCFAMSARALWSLF